jgi:hypothetical protein
MDELPGVCDLIGWEEGVKKEKEKKKDDDYGTLLWLIIGIVGSFGFMWVGGWGPKYSSDAPEGVGLETDHHEWLTVKFTGGIFDENRDTNSDDSSPSQADPAVIRQKVAELIKARGLVQLREGPVTEELLEISINGEGFVSLEYSRPMWYRANGQSYLMLKRTWSKVCGMDELLDRSINGTELKEEPDVWPPTEECLSAFIDEYLKANEQ